MMDLEEPAAAAAAAAVAGGDKKTSGGGGGGGTGGTGMRIYGYDPSKRDPRFAFAAGARVCMGGMCNGFTSTM